MTATLSDDHVRSAHRGARGGTAAAAVIVAAIFVWFSHRPLWHTDLWGHLQYGEIILTERAIPASEPIMPLAQGVPFVDTAWLTQVIGYATFAVAGVAGLQCLYAAAIAVSCGLILTINRRKQRGLFVGMVAVAGFLALNWRQITVIRPQLAGVVCFFGLLALTASRRRRSLRLITVPAVMVLWANLHGSFIVGIAWLVCFAGGRILDLLRRSGKVASIAHDKTVRRRITLLMLSSAATLLNPYGIALYWHVLTFSRNANLADLTEWHRLSITTWQGQAFAAAVVVVAVLMFLSPRRITWSEFLPLLGLGAATVATSRMVVWFAPVAVLAFIVHGGAVWNRIARRDRFPKAPRRRWIWAAVIVAAFGFAVVASPWGWPIWSGHSPSFRESVSRQTPVAAAEFLLDHPPAGQMFNTYEWGDYLSWVARRHDRHWPIFVHSHAHLVPREVWVDYMAVIGAPDDWQQRLDKYDVRTVVVDKRYRSALIARLRGSASWRLVFEDDVSAVFEKDRG